MVRFSDMLGGSGDHESPRATTAPAAPPAEIDDDDVEAEAEADLDLPDASDDETVPEPPEEVLNRLAQYASSTRAADPPEAEQDLTPVGDDLLPHPKGDGRKHRKK